MLTGVVVITGGAGTLGQAIMTVARKENWNAQFIIYSRGELQQARVRARFPEADYVIGDVRDYDRLSAVVAGCDALVHGAALKRIPDCEANVSECVMTNVVGSLNVVRACIAHNVKRAICIGTDKEVRATTPYGHSKGLATALFAHAPVGATIFTGVRYGNVVASRGSVIPIWREQAASDKPLTLTNGAMTRFFMSPFEAVKLIQLAAQKTHGDVVVGKMGALSIKDLAHIIAPGAPTIEVGLRSAEKVHEDLIQPNERAIELGDHFLVARDGQLGLSYSSDIAPRISREAFLQMLADAESLEQGN